MDGKRGRRGLPRPGRTRGGKDAQPREAAAPGAVPEARRRGLPAQAHVVALAAAVLLPLALAAAALLWRAAEAERDRSRQDALGLARRLAADVDRELDGVVLTLQALATSPALQAGDLATFAAQARAVPGFRGGEVVLSDRAGRPLVSAGAPEAPLPASAPAELGEAAAAVFASGAPLVSDLPAETAGGRFLLLVEVPARREGAVAFALGVTLPPARLAEALAADLPSPAWTAAVVDGQGRIVVRSREAARPAAGLAPEDARRDATEPEGLRAGAAPDGTPVLVAYARPRLAPWRVEDEVPTALVEAPLRRLWWLLAGMAPVLGLATAAAGWWGGRLSREVRRLAAAAAAIERGEPVRPVASPVREINGIGEALAVAAAERATAEAALRESERRFRDFAEAGSDWFWETDAEHRFVWQSANVGRTSGVPAEWAYGKTRLEIAAPDTDPAALEAHRRTLEAHRPFRDFEYLRRGPLGDVWLSTSGVPVFDEAGRLAGYRGIGRDITATKRAEEQVHRLAHHDPLTGLPNRVLFRDRFGQALALAGRGGGRLAVLLLDLDDFKGVNDTLGHPTGDALLRGIAAPARRPRARRRHPGPARRGRVRAGPGRGAPAGRRGRARGAAAGRPGGAVRPSTGGRCTWRRAWASRCTRRTGRTRTSCSRTPTWRCTGPRPRTAAASGSSSRRWRRRSAPGASWRRSCATAWSGASSRSSTSRSSTCGPAGSPGSRRCCAGPTRSAARWRRASSCRWRRRAG